MLKYHQICFRKYESSKGQTKGKKTAEVFLYGMHSKILRPMKHFPHSGYRPLHPYFGNALDLGLYSAHKIKGQKTTLPSGLKCP
jgi:hypothetical protein